MVIEGIGASVLRKEDRRFITGRGKYVDDMQVPGMKHAVFVRSPHAHATFTDIDASTVKAILSAAETMNGTQEQIAAE